MTTRRQFLIGSTAVAGGFVVACRLDPTTWLHEWSDVAPMELTPYVVVDRDGIRIIAPRAEMGQGIHTTLAALVAEELDVPFDDIRVEHGPASDRYANEIFYPIREARGPAADAPRQATGGQTSIRDAFVKMRKAGAAARLMLLEAAAARLGVAPHTLRTDRGAVVDGRGTRLPYVRLAVDAASVPPQEDPPLKPRTDWTLLGASLPRVDMRSKCTGTAEYGLDVRLPGLLHATVKRNPRLGGRMRGFEASRALAMRGVVAIVPLDTGVIVIATNTWYAFRAAEEIDFEWEPAPYPDTTKEHREQIASTFTGRPAYRARNRGDVDAALAGARVIEGEYHVPYVAHAPMEPLNATALLKDGSLDIWAGNQFPTLAVQIGARLTGLPADAIRVHTPYMGGAFGRRFEMDDVVAAIRAAQAVPGRPVRVTYSREEDFTHDAYRPMATARFRACVANGVPSALDLSLAAPSLFVSGQARRHVLTGEPRKPAPKADISIAMGAREQPYRIDNYRVTAYRPRDLLPVGWWRSVGASQNSFFHESIMDELAHAAGADPLTMRLSLLGRSPSRRVLESVGDMSNWGSDLPAGHARGLALTLFKRVATAQVIEISYSDAGITLVKAYAAVHVGVALDRRNIEAQVQGALTFGLSAAIFGEITVTDGVVDQTNFDTYPLLKMYQAPSIEVRIHELDGDIRGIGEAATPAAAPALGNAIFAATGTRVRQLPFSKAFRFV